MNWEDRKLWEQRSSRLCPIVEKLRKRAERETEGETETGRQGREDRETEAGRQRDRGGETDDNLYPTQKLYVYMYTASTQ